MTQETADSVPPEIIEAAESFWYGLGHDLGCDEYGKFDNSIFKADLTAFCQAILAAVPLEAPIQPTAKMIDAAEKAFCETESLNPRKLAEAVLRAALAVYSTEAPIDICPSVQVGPDWYDPPDGPSEAPASDDVVERIMQEIDAQANARPTGEALVYSYGEVERGINAASAALKSAAPPVEVGELERRLRSRADTLTRLAQENRALTSEGDVHIALGSRLLLEEAADTLASLQSKNSRLVEALTFYADRKKYQNDGPSKYYPLIDDEGAVARAALKDASPQSEGVGNG